MAKVKLNAGLGELSGGIGNWVFRQQYGQTVIAVRPEKKSVSTPAQKERQQRFLAATDYARNVLADPLQRRLYQALAAKRKKPVNALLISNWLTPPVIELIDVSGYRGAPGDLIKAIAMDDIEVVAVRLSIREIAGVIIEQGAATRVHGVWIYRATRALPLDRRIQIEATATDRPGHDGTATVEFPTG